MRKFAALCLWLLAAALPAAAQDLPALFRVTGVATDDVLNIRSAPTASAPVIGSFAPHEIEIEVTGKDDSSKWASVNFGEATGWASLRYLTRQEGNPDYAIAQHFTCFGTEPFWSLQVTQGQRAVITLPDTHSTNGAGLLQVASGRTDRFVLGIEGGHAAIIRRQSCDDGMSDFTYGLAADLLLEREGLTLLSGCCSITP